VTFKPTSGGNVEASLFCMLMRKNVIFIGVQIEDRNMGHQLPDEVAMLSEHVLPSHQRAPEVSEWRAKENMWMQQAFTTFVISSALIFGFFSFLTSTPTTKIVSLGCSCSGFTLKYSSSGHGKSDQSSAAGWTAKAFNSLFLKPFLWRQHLILSAYWSTCWATAELSLQAGTMKHGCYIVLHLITQLCLAPVTNTSPKRFMLVSLVQAHRWHRFHHLSVTTYCRSRFLVVQYPSSAFFVFSVLTGAEISWMLQCNKSRKRFWS